jgi:hypothetical protein
MRLPRFRPRFTVRSLMIAVAIVGLVMGASLWLVEMRARSAAYRWRAFQFGSMTCTRLGHTVRAKNGLSVNPMDDENRYHKYAWAHKLAEKYWRLADRLWLPVEPDPPPPEPLAHPRVALDCPAEIQSWGWPWHREPFYPWWTFLWSWRGQHWPQPVAGGRFYEP